MKKAEALTWCFPEFRREAACDRLDTTVKTESAPIGTGRFTESVETDAWGNPVYVTTEYEGQYPKYDAEGNLLTRNRPVNRTVTDVPTRRRGGAGHSAV